MAHAGGRLTEFSPEMEKKVRLYFEEYEPFYECPVEKQDKDGNVTTAMERVANPPPSMFRLAKFIGVNRSTVYYWMDSDNEFSDLVKGLLKDSYSEALQENAMMGKYNCSFAIFAAKNRLGWKDKSEITGADNKPLIPDLSVTLNKIYGCEPAQIHSVG